MLLLETGALHLSRCCAIVLLSPILGVQYIKASFFRLLELRGVPLVIEALLLP